MQRLENGRFEHLDTQAGLAPVPSLSVVAESEELANGFVVSVSREDIVCGFGGKDFVGVVFREPASPGNNNAPNVVVSSEPDPLRNRAVLLLGLGQLLLGSERLVALERKIHQCPGRAISSQSTPTTTQLRQRRRIGGTHCRRREWACSGGIRVGHTGILLTLLIESVDGDDDFRDVGTSKNFGPHAHQRA